MNKKTFLVLALTLFHSAASFASDSNNKKDDGTSKRLLNLDCTGLGCEACRCVARVQVALKDPNNKIAYDLREAEKSLPKIDLTSLN